MFKEQLEYVTDIFCESDRLSSLTVELHSPDTDQNELCHSLEGCQEAFEEKESGASVSEMEENKYRQIISRPDLKKDYKCQSLGFLPGFLTMTHPMEVSHMQPFPEGHLWGDLAVCFLVVFSLIYTHTHDKVNRCKFLIDTQDIRYYALYKDSL